MIEIWNYMKKIDKNIVLNKHKKNVVSKGFGNWTYASINNVTKF